MGQIRAALAQTTDDNDTRWLAIRGLGKVKFWEAPFLIDSLESGEHYVRVNATRALGELRCIRAAPTFIHLLEAD
jgi:HEAT repeat protein